tara:strand:- start:4086 stop:4640 length:555 start_codon:yes stop_codon:yes gene_type:complete
MKKNPILSDSQLVLNYQSGNKDALILLVKKWHKQFCNKAFWIVKDAEVAKDIAQDCWSIIIPKLHDLKDTNSFGSWALRIVYTKSLDHINENNKKRLSLESYKKEQQIIDNNEEVKLAAQKDILNQIKLLPPNQQLVIRLFYLENYSLKEISKQLNVSIGTTKSRLFTAREKLKQSLKNKTHEN